MALPTELETRTKLPESLPAMDLRRSGWRVSLYHMAGEAVAYWSDPSERKPRRGRKPDERTPEQKAAASRARAGRRARGQVRRFAKANRLNRLWTLTYAKGKFARHAVVSDMRRFLERLQARYGRLPLLLVLEWHPGGHGLHIHFLAGRWLPEPAVAAIWGHGFVHAKKLKARSGQSATAAAAVYAAKYVSKDSAQAAEGGERGTGHRYYVSEGWQPYQGCALARDRDAAIALLCECMGEPEYLWLSADVDDWEGPPTLFMMWGVA